MRTSLWIVPAACVVLAIVLAEVVADVDRVSDDPLDGVVAVDTARAMLSAIASGMIVFTGFVFSTALLVVQFGSTAFSPRLIRVLRQDRVVKYALGLFTATFVYALWVLSDVGSERETFVPILSWLLAMALLLASIGAFLLLIQRLVNRLRIACVASDVARRARAAIDALYPAGGDLDDRAAAPEPGSVDQVVRHRGHGGVIVAIDRGGLVRRAQAAGATIAMVPRVGDFVADGAPLFVVRDGRIPERRLLAAVAWGDERTIEQDPLFAFRVLVDIAIKALSPAINDPTTAVQVLDRVEELLLHLAPRRLGIGCVADRSGAVRLVHGTPEWDDYLDLAVTEIRGYGERSVQVVRRLRALLQDLGAAVPEPRRAAVEEQVRRLDASAPDRVADRQGLGSGHVEVRA